MSPLSLLSFVATAQAGVVKGDPAGLDSVYAARRVAVLVGVQEYADPALQGLRFAAKDARDLGAALESPTIGGFDRVFVVEGRDSTTAAAIERAIGVATADLQRDDTFVLYLSGHGTLTLDPELGSRLWFLPSDGQLDAPEETGIALSSIEARIADLPARRRVCPYWPWDLCFITTTYPAPDGPAAPPAWERRPGACGAGRQHRLPVRRR